MGGPFIGSEALALGMTWGELQQGHTRLFRDVYAPSGREVDVVLRAQAAWLWSRRRGVVAGFAAAALHGSKWVDQGRNIDLYHGNRHRLPGLHVRSERMSDDQVCTVAGVMATTPERTALDLACWYPPATSVPAIDALARASDLKIADLELLAEHQSGRRGIVRARRAIALADAGAQSPKESWLRAAIVEAGLPRPRTQIPIYDDWGNAVAYLDMGWEEFKVAVEYDGDHHRTSRSQYSRDIRRLEMLQRSGWIIIRVTSEHSVEDVLRRVRDALARRQ